MNEKERYLFDLQGYLLVENVLSREQLDVLNRSIDDYQERQKDRGKDMLMWDPSFRDLMVNPIIKPYLVDIVGEAYRLDHEYTIIHQRGAKQLELHGGGTPYDPGQYYQFIKEKIYSGLTVVSFAFTDLGPDDGGFCCIPGSHKSNYHTPTEFRHYDEIGPTVHIPQKAGDVVIFTEALAHGTFAWQADHERRSALYKYCPSMIAWGTYNRSQELMDVLTHEQKSIVQPPINLGAWYDYRDQKTRKRYS